MTDYVEILEEKRFVAVSDEYMLHEIGTLEPEHPSPVAHADRIARLEAEFTPLERRLIRTQILGEGS